MLGTVFLTTMEIDLNKIGNDFLHMMGFSGGALVKKPLANAEEQGNIWSLDQENPLEKEIATHSSILVGKISWREVSCGL